MGGPLIGSGATIVASPKQVSTDLKGEVVMLNFEDGTYYGLDQVGARIWSLVKEPRTLKEICDTIVAEYDVQPARCEADVRTLLGELAAAGLVEVTDAASP